MLTAPDFACFARVDLPVTFLVKATVDDVALIDRIVAMSAAPVTVPCVAVYAERHAQAALFWGVISGVAIVVKARYQ